MIVSKELYLREKVNLKYPNFDDLVVIIRVKSQECLLFKKDLKSA